jgi:hypothetical protein
MLNAEEAKFADNSWYNPFQYKHTSKSNILPDDLYKKLLKSKVAFSNEPSKKIVNGETVFDLIEFDGDAKAYGESHTLSFGEFDHTSALDYSLYTTGYPEWEQAIDFIKAEMESYCNAEVHLRRWAFIPNPPNVTFHFDYFTHLVKINKLYLNDGIDLSKYFISFLIVSDEGIKANTFKAGKTSACPSPNGVGLEADVKANEWFMHSQNLGHQYLKKNPVHHDFFCTCWMIK